jgi:6-pyruvoyltetrahydropterin/6-carboxytetrahydropterin synthase
MNKSSNDHMYKLAITRDFISQHHLIGGDWGAENDLHSHHYRCEIGVEGNELDRHGYLIDIVELNAAVNDVISEVGNHTLNALPAFEGLNPSLEHFARIFWDMLTSRVSLPGRLVTVKLWENEHDWAAYSARPD